MRALLSLSLLALIPGTGCTEPQARRGGGGDAGGASGGEQGAAEGGDPAGPGEGGGGANEAGGEAGGQAGGQAGGEAGEGGEGEGGEGEGGEGEGEGGEGEGEGGEGEGEGGSSCEVPGECVPFFSHCGCQWTCAPADEEPEDCGDGCHDVQPGPKPECDCQGGVCVAAPADACADVGGCSVFFSSCNCDWACIAGNEDPMDCDVVCPPEEPGPQPTCRCHEGGCVAEPAVEPPPPDDLCVQMSYPDVHLAGFGGECDIIDFACEEGQRRYSDDCSCGCIDLGAEAFACDSDQDCVPEDCCRPTGCVAAGAPACNDDGGQRDLCCRCEDCRATVEACGCIDGLCRTRYDREGCG